MAPVDDAELTAMQAAYAALQGLKEDEQRRILEWLHRKLGIPVTAPASVTQATGHAQVVRPASVPIQAGVPAITLASSATPKAFLLEKRPATDVERVTCLAYYLTHFRNLPEFKTKDITQLNAEAARAFFGTSRSVT